MDDRILETTKYPGIYKRHATGCDGREGCRCACDYVVRWKHRGRSRKRVCRTMALAREFKGKIDGGGDRLAPTRQTVEQLYEGWIDTYRGRTIRGLEETTRNEYRSSFDLHVLPYPLARMKGRDVGSRDIADWFGDLERAGASPTTIRKAKAAVSAMFATAAQEGAITSNPVLGVRYVPSVDVAPARKRRELAVNDVMAILRVLAPEWRLFFELLVHSGLRVGEALGLTWRNVHLGDDPHLMIVEQVYKGRRKRLKTVGSERRIPLSAAMAQALTAWKVETPHGGESRPVFPSEIGTPMSYSNVYNRVLRPALKDAGIAVHVETIKGKNGKRNREVWNYQGVAFHAFRKACGSILLQRAGKTPKQVQGWLGHSKLTTTMDIYQHLLDDGLGGADGLDSILVAGDPRGHRGDTGHPQTTADESPLETADTAL